MLTKPVIFEKNVAMNGIEKLISLLESSRSAAAFTGAGVSTLSGIRDFRGAGGIYQDINPERMFDISWFTRDPHYYYRHAREYIYTIHTKKPSLVHQVLAELGHRGFLPGGVITQNIDCLHEKAGSRRVMELHGSICGHTCMECGTKGSYEDVLPAASQGEVPLCSRCRGVMKPDVVFFGDPLPQDVLELAYRSAASADLLLVLGSSLVVHPAASIPLSTLDHGGKIVIVNQTPTPLDDYAELRFHDLQRVFEKIARHFRMDGLH